MADLVQFPRKELPPTAAKFLEWTREIAIRHKPGMAAFFILAWGENGDTTICADTTSGKNPIPAHLLPSWIAEHARAELVTCQEVKGILRDIGLMAPPPDKPA